MIPDWNQEGVLPPALPGGDPAYALQLGNRSPYHTSLPALISRFAINGARAGILQGFLDYRTALRAAGIVQGFQWIDGSFVENTVTPNDIDVVTFYYPPESVALDAYRHLFQVQDTKNRFRVDAYGVDLGSSTKPQTVSVIAYWYSLWSLRRDGLAKGFVQVDLKSDEDLVARQIFNLRMQRRG